MKRSVKNCTVKLTWIKENKGFLILLITGLILRIGFVQFQGLSNDELSGWIRTRFYTWDEFWYYGVSEGDMHPVLYQALLFGWLKMFGEGEWAIRSLSLLFFTANFSLLYFIGKKHFSKFGSYLIISVFALLGYMIIYTTFSRPYSSGLFFVLLSFCSILNFMNSDDKLNLNTALLSLGFIGAMLSHYFAFLTIGVMGGIALFFVPRRHILRIIIAGIVACILFLPHLSVTIYQLNKGGLGWLPTPEWNWLFSFFKELFNDSIFIGVLILSMISVPYFIKKQSFSKTKKFSLLIFLFVYIIGHIISISFTPILHQIVLIYILPMLFFAVIPDVNEEKSFLSVVLIGSGVIALHTVFIFQVFKPIHFAEFKRLGSFVNEKVDFDQTDYSVNFNSVGYLNYYLNEPINESIVDWSEPSTVYKLNTKLSNASKKRYLYAFSNTPHIPVFYEVIRLKYPIIQDQIDFFHSGATIFSKGERELKSIKDSTLNIETNSEFFFSEQLKIKELRELVKDNEYFLVQTDGKLFTSAELYFVAVLNRDDQMLKIGENPAFYQTLDQSKFFKKNEMSKFFLAFDIPEKAKDEDEIQLYFWNPKKVNVQLTKYALYVVNPNK